MAFDSVKELFKTAYDKDIDDSGVSIYKEENKRYLEAEIEAKEKKIKHLSKIKSDYELEIAEKDSEIRKLKNEINKLKSENQSKQNDIDGLVEINDKLKNKVNHLYGCNSSMTSSYFSSQKEVEELKNKALKYDLFCKNQKQGKGRKELKYSSEELYYFHKNKKMRLESLAKECNCSISTIKNRIKEYKEQLKEYS